MKTTPATLKRVYAYPFASIHALYVTKVERKGRTKAELDEVIRWLTGYTQKQLESQMKKGVDLEAFFKQAAKMNPARKKITGMICGVRVEDVKEKTKREIRSMDKLVDELANGRAMEKVLRK